MPKDWIGNKSATFATLAASNHSAGEREVNDYYATEPKAAQLLMQVERFSSCIWECACGEGHLAKEFEKAGYQVYATDKVDRGYGYTKDFLTTPAPPFVDLTSLPTLHTNMLKNLLSTLWR
jgi:hypothetical protein